jgi:hypothetical protein
MNWISSRKTRLIKYGLFFWVLNTAVTGFCAKGDSQGVWDPVSVFKIQWILNAGLPEGKLCLSRSEFQSFYLTDGNVIVGRKEVEADSFYVIDVEKDLAEEIPSKESVLVFKRDVRDSK